MRSLPPMATCFMAVQLLLSGAVQGQVSHPVLAEADLVIQGLRLAVSPVRQDVDPGRPTVVHTSLGDVTPGQIPAGVLVEGELSGPGIAMPLRLTAVPGEPFLIPGLAREGSYLLSGIRMVDNGRVLLVADPPQVEIVVSRLVISSVTSRPLTLAEIQAAGIVISDDNHRVYRYTAGFQTSSGIVNIDWNLVAGPNGTLFLPEQRPLPNGLPPAPGQGGHPLPVVRPISIPIPGATGGDGPPDPDPSSPPATIPGFLVIPADMSFLNQFFSVILVIQNGALEGSGLELRDLSATLQLTGDGLRQAETSPPTVPGQPVPVVDPGPDGIPGTADDLVFLVAQAAGQASWLVEGLKEGNHILRVNLQGMIHGLATGEPAAFSASVPGVVVVRDPRFALTFFHPWVVRSGEQYEYRVVVSNLSTAPVNDLTMTIRPQDLSGAILAPDEDSAKTIPLLPAGSSESVNWRLIAQRTGRVVATAFNSPDGVAGSFVFTQAVGELGIPLSPESLVLSEDVYELPENLRHRALELLGLAYSLAKAPAGVEINLPPVGERVVRFRAQELIAHGKRASWGESLDRVLVSAGLAWQGATFWDYGFDALRRASAKGLLLEAQISMGLGSLFQQHGIAGAKAELEEVAISGRPLLLVYARDAGFGGGARLSVSGERTGRVAVGQHADATFVTRTLAGGSILAVNTNPWKGEVAMVVPPLPEDDPADLAWETGYQVKLHGVAAGSVNLEAVVVLPDGSTRRFAPAAIATAAGSIALLRLNLTGTQAELWVDSNGNGLVDRQEQVPGTPRLAPSPSVLAARLDQVLDNTNRQVSLLASQPLDAAALMAAGPEGWLIQSNLTLPDGDGLLQVFRDRNVLHLVPQGDPRFLALVTDAPLNRHAELTLEPPPTGMPFVGGRIAYPNPVPLQVAGWTGAGAVRGQVRDPEGEPAVGVEVELFEADRMGNEIEGWNYPFHRLDRVMTDHDGGFVFDAVRYRGDDATVPPQYAGFILRTRLAGGLEARGSGRLFHDQSVRTLNLVMLARGTIAGTLQREDGLPLERPLVQARSVLDPTSGATAIPAADGSFTLASLPVGAIELFARDGMLYTFASTAIAGAGDVVEVTLVLPAEAPPPLGNIRGSVLAADGQTPAAGLHVFAGPAGSQRFTHSALTCESGGFAMDDVPSGLSGLSVWDASRGRYVAELTVTIVPDTTTHVVLVVNDATGTVSGTVYRTDAGTRVPVPGALISSNTAGWTYTGDAGGFEFSDVPLGPVHLQAFDPVSGERGSRSATLTQAGQALVLDLDLGASSGAITGVVFNRDGDGVAGANVAVGYFGSGLESLTDIDGRFGIDGLVPGNHELLVRLGDARLGRGHATIPYNGAVAEVALTLGGTVDVEVVTTALTQGGELAHVLSEIFYRRPGVGSDGKIGALPEYGYFQCGQESPEECTFDNEGVAHISGLPEGVGYLEVRAVNTFYGERTTWLDLTQLSDGQRLEIRFDAPGSVAGHIVETLDDVVVPVAGALVELWSPIDTWGNLAPIQRVTTEYDGAFQFGLVQPRGYQVRAYHPASGRIALHQGHLQSAQAIEDLDVPLRGLGNIAGQVALCADGVDPIPGTQVIIKVSPRDFPRPFIGKHDDVVPIPGLEDRELAVNFSSGSASFAFSTLVAGRWDLSAASPLHGQDWTSTNVHGEPGADPAAAELCLRPTGSVAGAVLAGDTGLPVPDALVTLWTDRGCGSSSWCVFTSETAGSDGAFHFVPLAVGAHFRVTALDPATGRGGASPAVRLCASLDFGFGSTCWDHASVAVAVLEPGSVAGVVRSAAGEPVGGALVRTEYQVVAQDGGGAVAVYHRRVEVLADPGGAYAVAGVPAGPIELEAFHPVSHLYASQAVVVDPAAANPTEADLVFPGTAVVTTRVTDPFGSLWQGQLPLVGLRQTSPHLRQPSGGGGTLLQDQGNPVEFPGVVAGSFETRACVGGCGGNLFHRAYQPGELGARLTATMSDPPEDMEVELQLVSRAAVAVEVVDSDGQSRPGAEVTISGSGFYGGVTTVTQTGSDGWTPVIGGLGRGEYSVAATLTYPNGARIRGTGAFAIAQDDHGETLTVTVALEGAVAVTGSVRTAAGEPAQGALATLSFVDGGQVRRFQAVTTGAGALDFPAVPSGHTYDLEIFEAGSGRGRYRRSGLFIGPGTVDEDGVFHLGEVRLDDENPTVAEVIPANSAQEVPLHASVVVRFSELMRHDTLTAQRLRLFRHGSGQVATSLTIEDVSPADEPPYTAVTLVPAPLISETLYRLEVSRGVEDLAGRTMFLDFSSTFRTRDETPPVVLAVSPAHNPSGHAPAGPDVEPVVTFSEPVDPDSAVAAVSLRDPGGDAVAAQVLVQRDGFDARIRPASALLPDTFYTVHVSTALTDLAGNALVAPFTSTFRIRDLEPPVVQWLPPLGAEELNGEWFAFEGQPLTLRGLVVSNDALASVTFFAGGVALPGTPQFHADSGEYRLAWTAPREPGTVVPLAIVARDVSGNDSDPATGSVTLREDLPPTGSMTVQPAGGVYPNHTVTVTVDAEDDRGLASIRVTFAGAITDDIVITLGGEKTATRHVTRRVPMTASPDESVTVYTVVTDLLGQIVGLGELVLAVLEDTEPPVVSVREPGVASWFPSGGDVLFRFDMEDTVAIVTTELFVEDAQIPLNLSSPVLPGSVWKQTASATWQAPQVQADTEFSFTFTATDLAGRLTTVDGTFLVRPLLDPEAPVAKIECPTSGEEIVPGVQGTVQLSMEAVRTNYPSNRLSAYSVTVNGEFLCGRSFYSYWDPWYRGSCLWTPAPDAEPGSQFEIVLEVTDTRGRKTSTSVTVTTPTGLVLSGGGELGQEYDGMDVVLSDGEFIVRESLHLSSLQLAERATVFGVAGQPLEIAVTNALRVNCYATINVAGLGFPAGEAPAGVGPAVGSGCGAHFGRSERWGGEPGDPEAETFDSLYEPKYPGGGGSEAPGGGFLRIRGAEVSLDGVIDARGAEAAQCCGGGGGGGAVVIEAATIRGYWGIIDVRGGTGWGCRGGSGIVRMVAEDTSELDDFFWFKGPVLLSTPGSESGQLFLNFGAHNEDIRLARIGSGVVGEIISDGEHPDDVWVTPDGNHEFSLGVVGGWFRVGDHEFRIVGERDRGEVRLAGAAGIVSGGDEFVGFHRFFEITDYFASSYRYTISSRDEVVVAGDVFLERGDWHASDVSIGGNLTLGGRLSAHAQTPLRIEVVGELRVDQRGSISADGAGYWSGSAGDILGPTPPDVAGSESDSGASHGGWGSRGQADADVGETYGSLFRPRWFGASGSGDHSITRGGGRIEVSAHSISLDGVMSAEGDGGAGGSITVVADQILGSGAIIAEGSWARAYQREEVPGSASGGRIALIIDGAYSPEEIPVVLNTGGDRRYGYWSEIRIESAGAGTTLVRANGDTYGKLIVDQRREVWETEPVAWTLLPAAGQGILGPVAPDHANAANLWVSPTDDSADFDLGLEGYFLRVDGVDFQIIDQQNRRELLIADAAGIVFPGSAYRGVLKLDVLNVRGGARVAFGDTVEVPIVEIDDYSTIAWFSEHPPEVNPERIRLTAHSGNFWVEGEDGAVTSESGLGSFTVRNGTSGHEVVGHIDADGSFGPVAVVGEVGDELELEVSDAHPRPRTSVAAIGALPANEGSPAVNLEAIQFQGIGGQPHLVGTAGAVVDPNPPAVLLVRNLSADVTFSGTVQLDGSFVVAVQGEGGDAFTLTATDSHPDPAAVTVGVGSLSADNQPPVVDLAGITFVLTEPGCGYGQGRVGLYGVSIAAGAIVDEDDPLLLELVNLRSGSAWSLETASGEAVQQWQLWDGDNLPGDVLELRVTDSHPGLPLTTTIQLPPLPADNAGPPLVNPGYVHVLPLGFGFQVAAVPGAVCDLDGPIAVEVHNVATGQTWGPVAVREDGSFYVRVVGEPDDGLVLIATDSHPTDPMATPEISLGELPAYGVATNWIAMEGHTAGGVRGWFAILDGGTAVAPVWVSDGGAGMASLPTGWQHGDPGDVELGPVLAGLTAAVDVVDLTPTPLVLDGGDLVPWICLDDGPCPFQDPERIPVTTTGFLVRGAALSGYVFLAEEGPAPKLHVVVPPHFDPATGEPDGGCFGPVAAALLPLPPGTKLLEVLPGPPGVVAVLTDDPGAHLVLVDVSDPFGPVAAGSRTLAGPGRPVWGAWESGELFLGRSDGSVEIWRWGGEEMFQYVRWLPAAAARAAARLGNQLWVGLANGEVEQVDLTDLLQPVLLGVAELGSPVRGMSDVDGSLLVATESGLVHLWAWVLPPEINPDNVVTGAGLGQEWAKIEALATGSSYISRIESTWVYDDGWDGTCWWGSCTFFRDDQDWPPQLQAFDGVGIPSGVYEPTTWRPWYSPPAQDRAAAPRQLPAARCQADRGARGERWVSGVGSVAWHATAVSGEYDVEIAWRKVNWPLGPITRPSLATPSPVVEVIALDQLLVTIDQAGLSVWDLSQLVEPEPPVSHAVDVTTPQDQLVGEPEEVARVSLSDAAPVTAARLTPGSGGNQLLVAGGDPGRVAVIDISSPSSPVLEAELVLPDLAGSITALSRLPGGDLYVAVDNDGAAEVRIYNIDNPAAPQALAVEALLPGPPPTALGYSCDSNWSGDCYGADLLVVLRRGQGLDLFSLPDLTPMGSVVLPGQPSDVRVEMLSAGYGEGMRPVAHVTLGFGHGVGRVESLNSTPVVGLLHLPGDARCFPQEKSSWERSGHGAGWSVGPPIRPQWEGHTQDRINVLSGVGWVRLDVGPIPRGAQW